MQALDRRGDSGLQYVAECDRFHTKHGGPFLHQPGNNVVGEAAEVIVQDIQWHLARIEMEAVLRGHIQHSKMYRRVLVASESDISDLARLLGFHYSLVRAAGAK